MSEVFFKEIDLGTPAGKLEYTMKFPPGIKFMGVHYDNIRHKALLSVLVPKEVSSDLKEYKFLVVQSNFVFRYYTNYDFIGSFRSGGSSYYLFCTGEIIEASTLKNQE